MEKQNVITALVALAQDTRLDIFRLLVQAGATGLPAGTISEKLAVPAATLSFHLQQLRNAGLISNQRKGTQIIYSANYAAMNDLLGYLTENCCQGQGDFSCCTGDLTCNPTEGAK